MQISASTWIVTQRYWSSIPLWIQGIRSIDCQCRSCLWVNLMDFKNFAVASTTFQDVPNTPLEKMILLGSAFTLDLYTPWKVFKIGLNKRLKADRLRIILQTTRWCEMDINPSLLYQRPFRWHYCFKWNLLEDDYMQETQIRESIWII